MHMPKQPESSSFYVQTYMTMITDCTVLYAKQSGVPDRVMMHAVVKVHDTAHATQTHAVY